MSTRKRDSGDKEYLFFDTESGTHERKVHIIIERGDSIEQNVLFGVWTGIGTNENYGIVTGRIVLTRIQLRPKGSASININVDRDVNELMKREEWLSIQSVISYLQRGVSPPSEYEIDTLRNEINRINQRLEELEDNQKFILDQTENQDKAKKTIAEFREQIGKAEIDEVFRILPSWTEKNFNGYLKEVMTLFAKWSFIKKDSRSGIISFEQVMLYRNRVCVSLLELIDDIEKILDAGNSQRKK